MDPVPKLLSGLGWARLWRAKRGALEREKCNRETEGGGEMGSGSRDEGGG